MKVSRLLQLHPCIITPELLQQICSPLLSLGINYFSHGRVNQKGEVSGVSSDPNYFAAYLENRLFDLDLHSELNVVNFNYIHWDYLDKGKDAEFYYMIKNQQKKFHTFSIINKKKNEINLYHFSTDKYNPSMNMFYVNNLHLLEQFIEYYHEQILFRKELAQAYDLILPVKKIIVNNNLLNTKGGLALQEPEIVRFMHSIGKKYEANQELPKLTKRELQCANLIKVGKKTREIAEILSISPRTVEVYVERLKQAFNCRNKVELAATLTKVL